MRKELWNSGDVNESTTEGSPRRHAAASPLDTRRVHGVLASMAVIVATAAAVVPSRTARAATDVVANCNDGGPGSLRAAVADAVSGDTIMFAISCSTIGLTSGEIDIDKNLTISGPGSHLLAISGEGRSRVLGVGLANPSASVSLSGLTVEDGALNCSSDGCDVGGAGLRNDATVTLARDVLFSGNTAVCGGSDCMVEGGAILNAGTLGVRGDGIAVDGNTAQCSAAGCSALVGGIHNDGSMNVTGALAVDGNVARCVADQCGSAGAGFGGGGSTTVEGSLVLLQNLSACEGSNCGLAGAGMNIFGGGSLTVAGGDVDLSQNAAACVGSGCVARSGGLTANGPVSIERGSMRIDSNTASADTQHGAQGLVRGAGIAISRVGSVVVSSGSLTVTRNTASCPSEGCVVQGGGIAKAGALSLLQSRIIGNIANAPLGVAQGGGLYNTGGAASLTDSPVTDNVASGRIAAGGGVYVAAGSVTLDRSPVHGNTPDNCSPASLC